jgi:DICT domain-containing protein
MSFSVFETAQRIANDKAIELRSLGVTTFEDPPTKSISASFVAREMAMRHWCRVNEQLILAKSLQTAQIYVGFERMSRVGPVGARYQKIARTVKELWVYGEKDAPLPFTCTNAIEVGSTPLANEWFLLISSEQYSSLIAAKDLDGLQFLPTSQRRFQGLTTHNNSLIEQLIRELRTWSEKRIG